MCRAAGIDPRGCTPGELHLLAIWAGVSKRAPRLLGGIEP
jgi:hypothetical protein